MLYNEIWIASHFHIELRFKIFEETIISICNQTQLPNCIYISYSCDKDLKEYIDVEDLFSKYFNPLGLKYKIFFVEACQVQFDHLYNIYNKRDEIEDDDVYVSFLDDDDMYETTRIEDTIEFINKITNIKLVNCLSYLIDDTTLYSNRSRYKCCNSDFGCHTASIDILHNFFKSKFFLETKERYILDLYFVTLYPKTTLQKQLYYKRHWTSTPGAVFWNQI